MFQQVHHHFAQVLHPAVVTQAGWQGLRPDHGGPGGQYHRLRLHGHHILRAGPLAEPKINAQPLELHELVIGNAGQRFTDRQARLELRFAAGHGPVSPQRHLMAALGGGHRRFQPRNTRPDHRDPFGRCGGWQVGVELVGMRHARVVVTRQGQALDDGAPA